MKFTRSKDGVRRTNINVRFRVGYDLLEAAAANIVWAEAVDHMHNEITDDLVAEIASRLTKRRVEDAVRAELQATGYQGYGRDDEYYGMCLEAAQPYVRRFYPEAY